MSEETIVPPEAATGDAPAPSAGASSVADADVLAFLESERQLAQAGAKDNLDQVERRRKGTDAWGKGVLGLGTALLTALGIGKLSDFLPQHGAADQIAAILFLVVALGAVMAIGLRLSRVGSPIVMRANVDDMKWRRNGNPNGLKKREETLVQQVYDRFADLNGIDSVAQYAAVGTVIESTFTILADAGTSPADVDPTERPERITDITDKLFTRLHGSSGIGKRTVETYVTYAFEHPDLARAKASLVRAELRYVMTSALADLVDRRAVDATTDRRSLLTLALVPIGVFIAIALTYHDNASDLNRTRDWQDAKTCLEVSTAIKQGSLTITPPRCAFPAPLQP